jgi:hypothetical protein
MVDFDKDREANLSAFELTGGSAHGGLTVRDYFATKAISLAAKAWKWNSTDVYKEGDDYLWEDEYWVYISQIAYKIADGMMIARNQPRHVFDEDKIDAVLAGMPDEIEITVEEAFGLNK